MAIYALEIKHKAKGKGASAKAHAQYIAREGKYSKGIKGHDIEYIGHGNMPEWATESPMDFWEAADTYERSNGRVYTEIQVAIPRELSGKDRVNVIREFVAEELGDRHVYTVAVHNSKALDGGEQPHAHIMFSIRELDGIDRTKEQFFKRANDKDPEKGGAKKSREWSKDERDRDRVGELRLSWERHANKALEKAGKEERIDRRSLKDQGIDREPEPKMGPIVTQRLKRGQESETASKVIELRNYRKKQEEISKLESEYNKETAKLYNFGKERDSRNRDGEDAFIFSGKRAQVSPEERQKYRRLVDIALTKYERQDGKSEYRWKKSGKVAFVDHGHKITFNSVTPAAVKAGLQVAKEKGWETTYLKGSEEFRRESWVQAQLMGIKVEGYEATKYDFEKVESLKEEQRDKYGGNKGKDNLSEKSKDKAEGKTEFVSASELVKDIDKRIKTIRAEKGKGFEKEVDELYRLKYELARYGNEKIEVIRQPDGKFKLKDREEVRKRVLKIELAKKLERNRGRSR